MQYDLQIEDVNPIRRRLHFTVAQPLVKGELDQAFSDLKKRLRLPGFRRGKVPRRLLEARFGKQIESEVSGRLIERSYREAVSELKVAGQPAVEERSDLKPNGEFKFTIGVDVQPEVEVVDYKGVTVPFPVAPVTDEQVDTAVSGRLQGQTRIEEVTESRPVQQGDLVLTQLKLTDGDDIVADEPGTMINTAGERYYAGVETHLVGMSKDDTGSFEVTIGDGSVLDSLKGKSLQAEVTILAIQAPTVPELDDDLAKELGYEDGADAMRTAIREQLEAQADEAARNDARVALLQKLVDANDFDVPAGMVQEQLEALIEELKVRRAYGGQDPRAIRFTDAELADLRNRATFAAKASCVLAAVAKQEGLEVSSADLDAKIEEIATMRGQTPIAIRGYLEREGAFGVLEARIQEEKTLEWLLDAANLDPNAVAEAPAEPAPEKKAAPKKKKAAKKDDAPKAEAAPKKKAAKKKKAAEPAEEAAAAPSWNKKMTKAQLVEVAGQLGVSVTTKMKKDEIIAALEGA